ncbi:ABC transporter ATP-binding protein [Candidatus Woesearchaeota archaeon]|nr:ABC transporter ATP-binding protein [Candidatus Woesearchaeota archaeon]
MSKKRKNIDFNYNLRVYLDFLKKYKWMLIFVLIIVFLVEFSYIINNYLFKVVIDDGTKFVNKNLDHNEYVKILIILVIIYFLNLAIRNFLKFIRMHLLNILEMRVILDLKRKFFNHITHLSYGFHTTHKTGSLISRLVRGGNATERMTDVIVLNIAPLISQSIVVISSLLFFDLTSSFIVAITILLFVVYSIFIQNKQKLYNLIRNEKEDNEKAYISNVMTNIDSIKYFGKEKYIKNRFKRISYITGKALLKFWNYFVWLDLGQSIILGIGIFFLVYFPMLKFLNGNLEIGSLVFIYTVFGNLFGPLHGFVGGIRNYYSSMGDFQDLFQYGKVENEIKDKPDAKKLKIKNGEVEFKDISFNYNKRKIFDGFNLKINKNQKVALIGHSGAGKSTLVKLLYHFYNLDKGEILIDSKNINEFKQESLRSELSIVPQECVLFDDTIYNNIAFSNPNANKKDIINAIKFAQLDKIIKEFPDKENTIVGERGVRLSVGEKQRVSIARAILANKKILVLDEATSSLDSETEHNIQVALKKLMKDRTSLIIAHRLSTIMNADKIVVMKNGKIVQTGNHKELIKLPGVYKKLWNLQKGGYIK